MKTKIGILIVVLLLGVVGYLATSHKEKQDEKQHTQEFKKKFLNN